MGQLPQMNDLYEKYSQKGLNIIGLYAQSQPLEDVRKVVKDKNIKYPLAMNWHPAPEDWPVGDGVWNCDSLPWVWIVGVDGKIKFSGAKGYDKILQDELAKVKNPGLGDLNVPAELKEAAAAFAAGDYGKAWKLADAVANKSDAGEAALDAASAIKEKVDERWRVLRNKAEVAEVENDWPLCVKTWEHMAARFGGYEEVQDAKDKCDKLKADKKVQLELEAAIAIRVMDRALTAKKASLDEWIKGYREFAAKFKETSWHERVSGAVERMEEELKEKK